ncbi:MAG: hypothetical protein FWC51_02615, partial [Proteobacteria bacterium]|nr:hypothetical protein [Pseudomonadota bacterium]
PNTGNLVLTWKINGNCLADSCKPGYHPNGTKCDPDTISCTISNATTAQRAWNSAIGDYDICTPIDCAPGYHISANACVINSQTCPIANGTGAQQWLGNDLTGSWGTCKATSCNPGFTMDTTLTNELSIVNAGGCGTCRNKFAVDGTVAASTYISECTIGACLYQGQQYDLENNECVPICDPNGRSDATGQMKWNSTTHTCDITCKCGYAIWPGQTASSAACLPL